MYAFYTSPQSLNEVLALKARYGERARLLAGGTDLLIELDRGVRMAPGGKPLGLIDLTRVPGLAEIETETIDGRTWIHLGPLVTHNQCVASSLIGEHAFALARACWEVGAPQIRNRATIAGNIITASPANDSIPPLLALDATVRLQSAARGPRTLPLRHFITGFRQVDMAPDEVLTRVSFSALSAAQRSTFIKLGLRRAQAISVINVAIALTYETPDAADPPIPRTERQKRDPDAEPRIASAAISLGAVAPTVVRATVAEDYLAGQFLHDDVIQEAAQRAMQCATPIDDSR